MNAVFGTNNEFQAHHPDTSAFPVVTLSGSARLIQAEKSRTLLYISQKVASDSAFPFKKSDKLRITIDSDGERLVVEKVKSR